MCACAFGDDDFWLTFFIFHIFVIVNRVCGAKKAVILHKIKKEFGSAHVAAQAFDHIELC